MNPSTDEHNRFEKVSEKVNRKSSEGLGATSNPLRRPPGPQFVHFVTDRRTDKRQYHANSRSYYVQQYDRLKIWFECCFRYRLLIEVIVIKRPTAYVEALMIRRVLSALQFHTALQYDGCRLLGLRTTTHRDDENVD